MDDDDLFHTSFYIPVSFTITHDQTFLHTHLVFARNKQKKTILSESEVKLA